MSDEELYRLKEEFDRVEELRAVNFEGLKPKEVYVKGKGWLPLDAYKTMDFSSKRGKKKMKREEILEKINELEDLLYETDEEQEELDNYRKQARKSAKMFNIMIEEFEKEGFDRDLSIEFVKLSLGASKNND